ncbi:unnamed protein product [Ectocarpus sp. CCAP 1310/34]|nr:unnamed protein product [Ectocarpus sp. CCAP 1310/34]
MILDPAWSRPPGGAASAGRAATTGRRGRVGGGGGGGGGGNCDGSGSSEGGVIGGDDSGLHPVAMAAALMRPVDDNTNYGIVKFLPDKQTTTVTKALREIFVSLCPPRGVHRDFQFLRTNNGTELVNASVSNLLLEFGITQEMTSPDGGQKRDGKVERRIGLVREGGRAAFTEASLLFPDLQFPRVACDCNRIWPEAWSWMSSCINTLPRLDKSPDRFCPYEMLHGKRPLRQPLPFLMPGIHHARIPAKIAPKGERCFYLNPGDYHSRDCYKVIFPSGAVGYPTDVVWGYRRKPFVGIVPTYNGGAIAASAGAAAARTASGAATAEAASARSPSPVATSAGAAAARTTSRVAATLTASRAATAGAASARSRSPVAASAGATAADVEAPAPTEAAAPAFVGAVEYTSGGSVFPPLTIVPPTPAPAPPSSVPPLAPHLQRQRDRYQVTPALTRERARQAVAGGAARGLPGALALLSMEEDIIARSPLTLCRMSPR